MPRKFDIDDAVYAKWPGSAQYFKAKVIAYNDGKYEVKFDDDGDKDNTEEVYAKHMMSLAVAEEAQKNTPVRKRSRSTSRGRRSRSRSPSRRKTVSPSKETKSPTRRPRSPGRPRKKLTSSDKEKDDSQTISKKLDLDVQRVESEKSISIKDDEKSINIEEINTSELITTSTDTSSSQKTSTVTRRTTRSVTRAALQEQYQKPKEEQTELCSSSTSCSLSKLKCCFKAISSLFGAILAIIMPIAIVYGMYLSCKAKKSCTFLVWPAIPPCEKFFNWKSTGYVFGWFLFQLALTALPIGKKITGPVLPNGKRQELYLNGLVQFLVSMAVVGGLTHYGKFPYKYITVNYLSLVTASAIFGLILSVVVYIISRNADSKEPSGGMVVDFVNGRVTSPMLSSHVDLKIYAFKAGTVSWVLINFCYLFREMNSGRNIIKTNPSLALVELILIWYGVDLLLFEESLLYTATFSKEKFGCQSCLMLLTSFPFFCCQQARYLVLFPVNYPRHMYIIPILFCGVGYYIYRSSLSLKLLFRKDIEKANQLGIKSIPTKDGRGLLIDGFWGVLRHPNYTGDLMIILGCSMLCGFSHLLPWIWVISLVFVLIAMAGIDDERCSKKYGPSWQEYRERVKYKFIPYVC